MKNNKKKKIAVIAAIIAIIAIISAGTLAWFNDKDTAINKFAVSGQDGDFKVAVNETSEPIKGIDAIIGEPYTDTDGSKGLDFTTGSKKLIPGSVVSKKPVATNDSNLNIDQWVRVLVTIPKAAEWKTICTKYSITDLTTIFGGHNEKFWERLNSGGDLGYYVYEDKTKDTLTYAFYYKTKLAQGNSTMQLFDRFTIPGQLTASELQSITTDGYFNIVVEAHAVQATNNDAKTAIDAFKDVKWPIDKATPGETE